MGFENNQNPNSSEQNSIKKKHKIIIASVDIEQQARDIAEEKLLSSKAELKGFRGFFKKIWQHNLAHEYYRQKEIAQAKREIQQSGNLYAGEKGEKEDHENAMAAIVKRFEAEYEGENLLRRGEEKKTLKNDDPSQLKIGISDLIKRFVGGSLSEEQFQIEKKNLYGEHAPDAKNISVFADNLLEIAKQIKNNVSHGQGLDALDSDFEIVVGKAKVGVETEAQYNTVDKITEKIQKSFVGKFVNEATVASAVAIAYGTIVKGSMNVAQKAAKWVGPLGMGLSAGIGGAVAGVRESKRVKEERAQHAREMAKGKEIESSSKRRDEMEKFRYETKNANELSGNLKEALEGLKNQPSEQKLHAVLEHLNEINSRITFSEQEKIDLVSFSDSKDVEKERTNMYIAVAEAKVYLKRNIHADWATFYNDEQQLNEYLQHNKEVKIQKDFLQEKTLKDEAFNKMKRKKVAWAVTKGLGIGLGVGMVAQEIGAYAGNGKEGIFSSVDASVQDHHYSALAYLKHYISGDLPHDEVVNIKHAIFNPESIIHETSTHEAILPTKDFVGQHENMFSKIQRGVWADNGTPKPDGNELKLWWGGNEGSGIDKNGNYVFNVKHMTEAGSFHGTKHWDPQSLMKEGKIKLLLSLSGDTQNSVIEIPIDANGNAIIDPSSEIGKLAFANADGHAKFLGKFAEIAVMGEKVDGVEHVNVLATHLGKGIDSLKTIITDEHEKIIPPISIPGENINPVGYDVDAPFVIPVAGRRPMEQLKNRQRIMEPIISPSESEKGEAKEQENGKDYAAAEEAAILAALAAAQAARKAKEEQERQKQTEKKVQDWEMEFDPKKQEDILDSEYIKVEESQVAQQEKNIQDNEPTNTTQQTNEPESESEPQVSNPEPMMGVEPSPEIETLEISTDHPVRAVAWHTIHKLEQSPDLKYDDLNASTAQEGNKKFNELARKLWNELTVHGAVRKDGNGGWEIIERSDLDGESCLKLLELAGITVDRSRINFVENGGTADSGIILDTSNSHGVISEESGKRLIFDHHGEQSDRTTSATKFLYETLVESGLLEKKPYLDKYVEFVTRDDNKDFTTAENKKIFKDYHRNLYGINRKLSLDQIIELFEGGQDPMAPIPDAYLESHTYMNPATKKEETLAQLSTNTLKKMVAAKNEIDRMVKQGFVIDTGKDNFGKILIDVKKMKLDGRFQPRISGDAGGPIAAFARDFDAYLSWSPEENSFALFTMKKMPKDFLSQGRNTRGNMWTKNHRDEEPLKVTLEDILSKLSGKSFVIDGKLKSAIETVEKKNKEQAEKTEKTRTEEIAKAEKKEKISSSVKKMSDLFSDFELSYDTIKDEAGNLSVNTLELAEIFIQEKLELRSKFEAGLNAIPNDKRDEKAKEKLALVIIFEDGKKRIKEKIKEQEKEINNKDNELAKTIDVQERQRLELEKKEMEVNKESLEEKKVKILVDMMKYL